MSQYFIIILCVVFIFIYMYYVDSVIEKYNDESWGSWAWSFVPDVGSLLGTPDSAEQEMESNMLKLKKIFQFGIFIGKTSCILKHTVISSSKYIFSPSLVLNLFGSSMEFTSRGKDFLNLQTGVCGITVSGYEDCICDFQDFTSTCNEMKCIFLKSGVPPGNDENYNFLSSSLFDPLAPENCNKLRKYCFNKEEHLEIFTEEVLVQRYPAFAFDYLYELVIPEECIDKLSSNSSTLLEESNWPESCTSRFVLGPFGLDVTSNLVHSLKTFSQCAQKYEYPSYTQPERCLAQTTYISEDNLDLMEKSIPIKQYHFTSLKPVIHLFIANHSLYSNKFDYKKGRKKSSKYSKYMKPNKKSENLYCLEFYADCVDLQATYPMYPSRIEKVIESLKDPSTVLTDHSYHLYSGKIFGLELSMHKESDHPLSEPTILQQTSISLFMKILPNTFNNLANLPLKEILFECSHIHLTLSEKKFLLLLGIYNSWTVSQINIICLEKFQQSLNKLKNGFPCVISEMINIKMAYILKEDLQVLKFNIRSLCLKFQKQCLTTVIFHAPESTATAHEGFDFFHNKCNTSVSLQESESNFLQMIYQQPKEISSSSPVLLVFHLSGSVASLEPALFSWLSFDFLSHINSNIDFDNASSSSFDFEDASTCSSMTQEASASYSVSKSCSSQIDDYNFQEQFQNFLFEYSYVLSSLLIEVYIIFMYQKVKTYNVNVQCLFI